HEDAAYGLPSMSQFPMMFLSGAFFRIDDMPQFLQFVARLIPLTYLADALRQVMVGGVAFAPLGVCALVLAGWLVVCFGIASRKFQWQEGGPDPPAPLADDLLERPPPARAKRPGEVVGVGRVAEGQDVLAV